jgi:hypothetical protein
MEFEPLLEQFVRGADIYVWSLSIQEDGRVGFSHSFKERRENEGTILRDLPPFEIKSMLYQSMLYKFENVIISL